MNNVIIACGGTGGHIMPAIAIANELKDKGYNPIFVGSKARMEAEIVPKNGFEINFIWISALHRDLRLSNIIFPLKLIVSIIQSFKLLKTYQPKFVIGTGGFATGPILYAAAKRGYSIFLQEQNSYPGITTRLLEKYASIVFTAYERASDFLKSKSIKLVGNPIRNFSKVTKLKEDILHDYGLSPLKTITIIGGSQGSFKINNAISQIVGTLTETLNINIIWQAGEFSFEQFKPFENERIKVLSFIDSMDELYAVTDIVICRAGAITISEISKLGLPSIMIPLKSAAANHQYHNAKSLEDNQATILLEDDDELPINLESIIIKLITDDKLRNSIGKNIKKLAFEDSTKTIVNEILKTVGN